MRRITVLLALASALLMGMTGALAQTPTGAIEGTVTDPTGAAIPIAKVTITELATGRTLVLATNQVGLFSARNLLPGKYNLKIEAANFSTRAISNVQVDAGAVINADTRLEVGQTTEVVEVNAEAVQVDTARQTVDSVIGEKEIKQLPLFSRNFLDLAALAPGVIVMDGSVNDPTKTFAYRAVSVAGRSGTGTRVEIDGIDVTDETVGMTTSNVSTEAVNEFQLTRSSLDMSTSLTSSGAVSIITNSGSNGLHGSYFWDYYNQDLGARQNYDSEGSPFHRQRTGGSAGGPFVKDKLFWYVNYERWWQNQLSQFRAPLFPQLNVDQGLPTDVRYMLGRLDWNISPSVRMFYKWNHNWDVSTGGGANSPFQNIDWTITHTIGVDINKAHSTNSIRFGYVNFNNNIASQELNLKFNQTPNGIPYFLGVGEYQMGPNGLAPQATYQDNFQTSYDGSYLHGRHTFRYGMSVTRIILGGFANFAGPLSVAGVYDDQTVAALKAQGANLQDPLVYPFDSFTMGPANGFFTLRPAHNLPHGGHFNTRTAIYGGDNIKLSRRLTLNLGLRWEYDTGLFNNDHSVPRDPVLDRWIQGASQFPVPPKNLYSPSIGFAWDVTGKATTILRGGLYRGYEMNIFNNLIFDEFSMLPAGLGPDVYDNTYVAAPDGTPINVDGKHPDGDYSDLVGQPIGKVIGTIGQVQAALSSAYANYKFDPKKGVPAFEQSRGLTFGGVFPGNQFKIPYGLQFNIGIQHELRRGTVLSVDYLQNHGVGLPFMLPDFERRRDAGTLNVANATAQVKKVLAGKTVDQWIAANPTKGINSFGLISDSIFQGLYPDYTRARFLQGGFTMYRALQVSLRGSRTSLGKFKDLSYNVSYSLGRDEASAGAFRAEFLVGPFDNHNPNSAFTFGPSGLDHTSMLTAAGTFKTPGGFQFSPLMHFQSASPINLGVPNFGGFTSGSNGFFATDINGDGGTGTTPRTDILPGTGEGALGRTIKSFSDLNAAITAFNNAYAGKLTPHGQALVNAGLFSQAQLAALGATIKPIPLVPTSNPWPFHNVLTADLRFSRPVRIKERASILPYVDFINLFNHAPMAAYSGLGTTFGSLNYNYASAPAGNQISDLAQAVGRINGTRQIQIGFRVDF